MYHIIINPSSKSGRGLKIWKKIEPVLNEKNIEYKMIFSEYPGHTVKLVNKLTDPLEGHENVKLIVVGGDGTMNEVVQGIVDWDRITIGYIPTGSSNDFARAQHYDKDPVKHLNNILSSNSVRHLDVGLLTYLDAVDDEGNPETVTRRFDVSCGIGFDAAVCEEAMHPGGFKSVLNKIGLGKLTYLAIALKHLIINTGVSVSYILDNSKPINLDSFLFIAVMQNKYEGGGFKFCPKADPTDGLLDLCTVSVKKKSTIFRALPLAFVGKHVLFDGIDTYTATKVRIKTSGPLWVHTDGEVHRKSSDFLIESLPGKLHMLI